jgi:hypothetical protein
MRRRTYLLPHEVVGTTHNYSAMMGYSMDMRSIM